MTLLSSAVIAPSDGAGGFSLSALAGLGTQEAGRGDRDRAEQRDPVAEVEAHADLGGAAARLVDGPVVADEHPHREAHDHGHLTGRPRELVPPNDDPAQDQRRERAGAPET